MVCVGSMDTETAFFLEVWRDVRPYFMLIVSDAIRALLLLLVMKATTMAIEYLGPGSWAGESMTLIHEVGSLAVFGTLVGFLVRDLIRLKISE
jgi:hypothetical protein